MGDYWRGQFLVIVPVSFKGITASSKDKAIESLEDIISGYIFIDRRWFDGFESLRLYQKREARGMFLEEVLDLSEHDGLWNGMALAVAPVSFNGIQAGSPDQVHHSISSLFDGIQSPVFINDIGIRKAGGIELRINGPLQAQLLQTNNTGTRHPQKRGDKGRTPKRNEGSPGWHYEAFHGSSPLIDPESEEE